LRTPVIITHHGSRALHTLQMFLPLHRIKTIAVQNSAIPLELSFSLWEKVARRGRMRVHFLPSPGASRHPLPKGEGHARNRFANRECFWSETHLVIWTRAGLHS